MRWMIGLLAIVAASQAGAAAPEKPAPIQVMVLGTYHFDNPGLDLANVKADDVLKPERQQELDALAAALAEFRPTRIMVERRAKTPDLIDPRFAQFSPVELGKNRDERVQVAYRLAHRLGQKTVYAIDEQPSEGEPDYFPFDKIVAWAQPHGQQARIDALMATAKAATSRIEALQKSQTIAGVLADLNDPATTAKERAFYYELLSIGDTEQQPGADLNAMWYLRNAKIFAKLITIAKPGDRILVVYGSGHNYWLRHFAEATPGFVNVDPTPYLKRAAKAPR